MKILAFNGSPRVSRGNTGQILMPFLDGAKSAGAEVELINIRRAKINPCIGCFNCWFRTPGKCSINDDIHMLREKLMEADTFVLATPIYMFGTSGYMKILMERLFFPLAMPDFLIVDNVLCHPARFQEKRWKAVLIANAAFDGEDAFRSVTHMYERMVSNIMDSTGKRSTLSSSGIITVGFGELFADEEIKSKCTPLFDGMWEAGKQLAEGGQISYDTLDLINKPTYYFAQMTRQEAVSKTNELIAKSKSAYILPEYKEA